MLYNAEDISHDFHINLRAVRCKPLDIICSLLCLMRLEELDSEKDCPISEIQAKGSTGPGLLTTHPLVSSYPLFLQPPPPPCILV